MSKIKNKLLRDRYQKKRYKALGFISPKEAKKRMRYYQINKLGISSFQLLIFILVLVILFIYFKPWEIIIEILRII